MKGGYQTIDFGDINITSENSVTIPGIYESIEGTRKSLLIEGVTLEGVEKRSVFVECESGDGNCTFSAYGKTFTVTPDDKVTIA